MQSWSFLGHPAYIVRVASISEVLGPGSFITEPCSALPSEKV